MEDSRSHCSRFRSTTDRSAVGFPKGAVGDCWFLAGLAVISERADLIGRVVGSNGPLADELGCFEVNLFKDGRWERCGEAGGILVLTWLLEPVFGLFSLGS